MRRRTFLISLVLLFPLYGKGACPLLVSAKLPFQEEVVAKGPVSHELGAMIATTVPIQLATNPVTIHVPITKDAPAQIAAALEPSSKTKLVLALSGIDFDKNPEVHYQVYLNLPKNEQPDYKSIHFVGNLAFFSFHPHGGSTDHPPVINFDITKTVRDLISRKLWNNTELSVTFVVQWLVDANDHPLPIPPGVRLRFTTAKLIAIVPQT